LSYYSGKDASGYTQEALRIPDQAFSVITVPEHQEEAGDKEGG
jgi:hypothetical protein